MPYKNLLVRKLYQRSYSRVYMRAWRKQNPESAKAIAYRYERSEKRKAAYKRRSQNPVRRAWSRIFYAVRNGRRRAMQWGLKERRAITQIYQRAHQWRQWGFDVVVDHIIPLARGGLHHSSNLQLLYRAENRKKSARLDYVPTIIFT